MLPRFSASLLFGVGQREDPESVTLVARTNPIRADRTPLRIEPEGGKVSEDVGESSTRSESWDIFQEHDAGSYLANDAGDGGPDPAIISDSASFAGKAPRLTREAGRDEIHAATPRSAVEGCNIIPDRRWIQTRVPHPRHESGRGKGFPLDVAHATVADTDGELDSQLEAANPGT